MVGTRNTGRFRVGHGKLGGRRAGTPNKATAEVKELLDQMSKTKTRGGQNGYVRLLARLFEIGLSGGDQQAVAAAKLVLETRFGKPAQMIKSEGGVDLSKFPFFMPCPPANLDK